MSISRLLLIAADPHQPQAVRAYFAAEAKAVLDRAAPEPEAGQAGAGYRLLAAHYSKEGKTNAR